MLKLKTLKDKVADLKITESKETFTIEALSSKGRLFFKRDLGIQKIITKIPNSLLIDTINEAENSGCQVMFQSGEE